MARDGSGNYNLPSGQPVVTSTVISSSVHNTFAADVAAALTASIAKDGQTTPTANMPMGTFRHTGVGDGSARTMYPSIGQIQDEGVKTIGSIAGTADAITGSLTPAITAYVTGMLLNFKPTANNTTAVTIALNGLATKSIVKWDGDALAASDLVNTIPALILYNGTNFYLLNPQTGVLLAANGSVSAPAFSFAGDTNTGFYWTTADRINVALGGVLRAQLSGTAGAGSAFALQGYDSAGVLKSIFGVANTTHDLITGSLAGDTVIRTETGNLLFSTDAGSTLHLKLTTTGQLQARDGSPTAPTYSFMTAPDLGIYAIGTNALGIAVEGVQVVMASDGVFRTAYPIQAPNGSVSVPAYTFTNFTNTGVYAAAGPLLAFSVDGAKVAESSASLWSFGSTTIQTGAIEVGHASDTTLSRVSAGLLAVEGKNVAMQSTTVTANTVTSGTYAPTFTAGTNVASVTGNGSWQFLRIGDIVFVSGQANVDPTAAAPTASNFDISLPIASNIGATTDLTGHGGGKEAGVPASEELYELFGDSADNGATVSFNARTTVSHIVYMSFSYRVI